MLRSIQILGFLFFSHIVSAQVVVKGKVTDDKNTPIPFVLVGLQRGSARISNVITDSIGGYQFKNIKKGNYQLLFKSVSFKDSVVSITINTDTLMNVQLHGIRNLKEVAIRAKKPIFQREIDRLRFNVGETDLVFGNNIWEVIEKTPLLNVSSDGTIQISGTSGAIVYMNNKRKVLSGDALKNYLSSLPSENLEAIEVITTPPSKYDAEGGAGIINILTKKSKQDGFTGNAALSTRQTAVNSQAGSVYLNNREGNWNIYSSLYMGNRSRKPDFSKDIYYPTGTNDDLIQRSIRSLNDFQILYPGINLGIDHEINSRHVVGILFDYSGSWQKETRNAWSRDVFGNTDSLSLTNNRDDLSSQTYSLNLNYQGKIDDSGKQWSVDFDALEYRSANQSVSKTDALDLASEESTDQGAQKYLFTKEWFRSNAPQQVSNRSLKFDFEWPVSKTFSFNFGAKSSFSRIDNDLVFEDRISESVWIKDLTRSNLFRYDENINALYAMINHKISTKWSFQLGVRLENTVAKGWLEGVKAVDRNYTNVFPTAFLKYTTTKDKSYVLAVSSRITRPGFWDVNPFKTYTTDQTYFEGNPFLLPSKYYREELSHTLTSKTGSYTIQLAASQLLDEFYALPYNPSENVIANKKVNYGNKYSFSNTITYDSQLLPWWRMSGAVLTGYVISKGSYANDIAIDNSSFLLSLSANQTFAVSKKKGISCTLIGKNTFPATLVNTKIGNRLETEIRLRKSAGPWNITLSAQDLLKSNQDRYEVSLNEVRIIDKNYYDTRSVALSLSFNFGKSTVKDKRSRDAGSDEVKQRIG